MRIATASNVQFYVNNSHLQTLLFVSHLATDHDVLLGDADGRRVAVFVGDVLEQHRVVVGGVGWEAVYLAAVEAGGLRVEGQHNRANFEQGLLKVG